MFLQNSIVLVIVWVTVKFSIRFLSSFQENKVIFPAVSKLVENADRKVVVWL